MPRAGTRSASSDDVAWVVPESLRPALARRYGPVLAGAAADDALRALDVFGSCGDLVTARAIALDHPPLIGIVDRRTQRHEPIDPAAFAPLGQRRTLRVKNPAGMLTERLRSAVRRLVDEGGGLIELDCDTIQMVVLTESDKFLTRDFTDIETGVKGIQDQQTMAEAGKAYLAGVPVEFEKQVILV